MCRWMSRSRVNVAPVDDPSVKHVKAVSQHLSAESLDECFDVFTQQERVSRVVSPEISTENLFQSFWKFFPPEKPSK